MRDAYRDALRLVSRGPPPKGAAEIANVLEERGRADRDREMAERLKRDRQHLLRGRELASSAGRYA